MSDVNGAASPQPAKYWAFRNLVTIAQAVIVSVLVLLTVWWAITDGNGLRVWQSFYDFSQGISRWSHESLRFPWE